jgi:hypothetical protein
MEQHIVISSNKGRLDNPEIQGTKLITFELENDLIVGVRNEIPLPVLADRLAETLPFVKQIYLRP